MTAPASRYAWGARSLARLQTCHPLLIELMQRVIRRPDLPSDLTVLCGHRTREEQDAAVAKGTSRLRWPKSRHNRVPSLAVDVAPFVGGAVTWDWPHYHAAAPVIRAEWDTMRAEGIVPAGVGLVWGGDWATLRDGPHWELSGVVDAEGAPDPSPLASARAGVR